jgi:hypothetical protein
MRQQGATHSGTDVVFAQLTCIRAVCWAHNGCLPVEQIVAYWTCAALQRQGQDARELVLELGAHTAYPRGNSHLLVGLF